jgi:hypothetical protein
MIGNLRLQLAVAACVALVAACKPTPEHGSEPSWSGEDGAVARVGSLVIYPSDVDLRLREHHGGRNDEAGRQMALDELVRLARFTQAALDAGLDDDPVVRAEIARILASRHRERTLYPKLKAAAAEPVAESRLREIYQSTKSRYQSGEKRQVAVLWLNPKGNPEREKQFATKLAGAREWILSQANLKNRPEEGFSVLAVDHSEHQASRYKGGVVGWLEVGSGRMDLWTRTVAEIAFSLGKPGEVSKVITRPEGLFLVRYMATQPAVLRPFESVAGTLQRTEKKRLREQATQEFEQAIQEQYPVDLATPSPSPTADRK